jgi:hypothetical protein
MIFLACIILLEIIFLCFYIIILILEKLEIEKINTQINKKISYILDYNIVIFILIVIFLILTLCLLVDYSSFIYIVLKFKNNIFELIR